MAQNHFIALVNANSTLLDTFTDLAKLAESSRQCLANFKECTEVPYSNESLQSLSKLLMNLQSYVWKQKSAILTIETLTNYLLNSILISNQNQFTPKEKKSRKNKKKELIPAEPTDALSALVESCGIPDNFTVSDDFNFPSYSVRFAN